VEVELRSTPGSYLSIWLVATTLNQAPEVNAGPDETIILPNSATLCGTATDDGLPLGSSLTTAWSVVSGPGEVIFGTPAATSTSVGFNAPGTYVLRLTALTPAGLMHPDDAPGATDMTNTQPPYRLFGGSCGQPPGPRPKGS